MADSITAPYGLETNNPQPEIKRYYNLAKTPYTNTAQVLSQVALAVRYPGQTFNVNNVEYWFENAVTDLDLVKKVPTASNIGTGAQVFKEVSSNDYKFRKIKSTNNSVTIVEGINDINLSVAIPDGSETKIVSGTPNVVIEGNGTDGDEYVINVEVDGSETKIQQGANVTIEGDGTAIDPYIINAVNTTTAYLPGTGISIVANTVNNTAPDRVVSISGSGATTVTGTYPNFTISSPNTSTDGSETKINNGITTVRSGLGTTASPYVIETVNLQKVITANYTLTDADNEYTIFINSALPITITLNASITTPNFCVGFIQEGVGDVTFVGTGVTLINPIGLKSKGQGYQTFIERKLATSAFYLLGNTKSA